ncbi:MAG: hypothetical protein ACYS76_13410 [Planctomycetota bacterium]|jgi:hypothetical protein
MNFDIDWKAISSAPHGPEKTQKIVDEIGRVEHVVLSDCLVNRKRGGSLVLEALEKMIPMEERSQNKYRRYKLRVLRDKLGNPVRPGETVTWKQQLITRSMNGIGEPLTNRQMEAMKRRGEGDKLVQTGNATVDEYGCIEVGFLDASQLLNNHGQHYRNTNESGQKTGICPQREVSTKTVMVDGEPQTKRYKWNWRFEEVPPGTELELWREPEVVVEQGDSIEELEARIAKMKADQEARDKRASLIAEEARLKKEAARARETKPKTKGKKNEQPSNN